MGEIIGRHRADLGVVAGERVTAMLTGVKFAPART